MTYSPGKAQLLKFHEARRGFLSGSDTPRRYLERSIETIERLEPMVRAFVTLNLGNARKAADESTTRYAQGQHLSPIDGMPVGIKDLFETVDMPTQMGSAVFKGWQGKRDAAAVYGLRQRGALIVGKTVTTEFGFYHPGPTTNPFDEKRTPGGSSSGSAAAVGAAMLPVTIGSQVVGSLIRPASYCANFGFKPTLGALNRQGGHSGLSQSCIGVHAGCLEDLWATACEIAGSVGGDPGAEGLSGAVELSAPVKPVRLIHLETVGWKDTSADVQERLEALYSRLRREGVEIRSRHDERDVADFERALQGVRDLTLTICGYELRWPLAAYRDLGPGYLSEDIAKRLEGWLKLTPDQYRAALKERDELRKAFAALMASATACITLSATGPAPMGLSNTGDPVFAVPASVIGAPAVSLPLLQSEGMPVGVQLMGRPQEDARLMGVCRWICGMESVGG